jgi:hypothetical protein
MSMDTSDSTDSAPSDRRSTDVAALLNAAIRDAIPDP